MVQNSESCAHLCTWELDGLFLERVQPGCPVGNLECVSSGGDRGVLGGKLGSYMKEGGERGWKFKERRVKSLSGLGLSKQNDEGSAGLPDGVVCDLCGLWF